MGIKLVKNEDKLKLMQEKILKGDPGASAYEIAIANGFEGSEQEWLKSLEGAPGQNGKDGAPGKDGKDGYTPVKGVDYFDGEPGIDGADGKPGKDGEPGKDGKDGYTPVKGVDYFDGEKGEPGYTPIKGVDYFDGEPGAPGKDGADGKDGYTPIKGKDYFDGEPGAPGKDGKDGVDGKDYILTDADMSEITRLVIESLGGNPIFGYVDENNNIIVSGYLADGDYTFKYEMEDGSFITVGELVLDNVVDYTITKNLTNCSISNSASSVIEGESYSATISANDGYELKSVIVTMGGSSVSVTNGVINIESVTGNIVITAVAEETLEPTNFFDESQGFYGRLSSTGINRTDIDTLFVTGYIKVQQGDIITIDGCDICPQFSAGHNHYTSGYDINKTNVHTDNTYVSNDYWTVDSLTDNNAQLTVLSSEIEYFRFTCGNPLGYRETVDTSKIVINIKRNGKWL